MSIKEEKLYSHAMIEALPNITETALAMMDGAPEILMDACVFYLHHRPDRWEEIAEHHFGKYNW